MKFVIQSFSDIITNSSSEVFVSYPNEELLKILEDWGIEYKCYNTEEELRKAVEENPWDFDEITTHNPYGTYTLIEDLREMKSTDSIWEFFKQFYIGLLGRIIVDVDRDYFYRKHQESDKNIFENVNPLKFCSVVINSCEYVSTLASPVITLFIISLYAITPKITSTKTTPNIIYNFFSFINLIVSFFITLNILINLFSPPLQHHIFFIKYFYTT